MSMDNSAYVDTNILVSYALGPTVDSRYDLVKDFFNDVFAGKYLVVVSNFVLQEAIHTFRNIAIAQMYKELEKTYSKDDLWKLVKSPEFRQEVNDRSMKAFKTIVDIVTKDTEHFKLGDSRTVYPESLFYEGLKQLTGRMGDIRVYSHSCRKCDTHIRCYKCGFAYEIAYKSINAPDITHLLISGELGCKYFFSMEKDFANVNPNSVKSKIVVLS